MVDFVPWVFIKLLHHMNTDVKAAGVRRSYQLQVLGICPLDGGFRLYVDPLQAAFVTLPDVDDDDLIRSEKIQLGQSVHVEIEVATPGRGYRPVLGCHPRVGSPEKIVPCLPYEFTIFKRIPSPELDQGRSVSNVWVNSRLNGSFNKATGLIRNDNRALSEFIERLGRLIRNWQKGELLGRGTFGSVYEGIADDGFFFAVKQVSLLDEGEEGKQCIIQLEQETALLSQFKHKNIVQYYGTQKDENYLYIFLELVTQGSLLRLYQKYDLQGPKVSHYTRQILHGLKYLHDRHVIHRDIKCANILVDITGSVKLADFGLAKVAKSNDVKSCRGTVFWMAPEVVQSNSYGVAADIWSLGCTVLEMSTRRIPYSGLEWQQAMFKIGQGVRPDVPETLSSDAQDFILKCLQVDPSLRSTAAQLLDHPFVKRPL